MKSAGRVKIEPATTRPEAAPIDCMMTFSSSVERRGSTTPMPTAMIAMGIAASNTCPALRPRNAAAAENSADIARPSQSERAVNSGTFAAAGTTGS